MEAECPERASTTTFLVEHYWPGVTEHGFAAAARSLRTAADCIAAEGAALRYLHSTLVPADEAAFCVFEASSRALVEQAYARAGVRFERILDAVESSPRSEPSRERSR